MRDLGTLERAFSIQHDVLQDSVWGAKHANLADYGIQLSRGFRALKIWMSIQTFGVAAFRAAIENGLDLAARAAEYVEESPTLELVSASLGIVCFRANPGGVSEADLAKVNRRVLANTFGAGERSCRRQGSTSESFCDCASSTTTRPGKTSARRWKRLSGPVRWHDAAECGPPPRRSMQGGHVDRGLPAPSSSPASPPRPWPSRAALKGRRPGECQQHAACGVPGDAPDRDALARPVAQRRVEARYGRGHLPAAVPAYSPRPRLCDSDRPATSGPFA